MKRNNKTKICVCGNPMFYTAKTCRNCMTQKGDKNFNWKGGVSSQRMRYKRVDKERHPDQHKAREAIYRAIKNGKMTRGICIVCGDSNTDAHHKDYGKPLDVTWLCKKHHRMLHDGKLQIPT